MWLSRERRGSARLVVDRARIGAERSLPGAVESAGDHVLHLVDETERAHERRHLTVRLDIVIVRRRGADGPTSCVKRSFVQTLFDQRPHKTRLRLGRAVVAEGDARVILTLQTTRFFCSPLKPSKPATPHRRRRYTHACTAGQSLGASQRRGAAMRGQKRQNCVC